MIARYSRGIPRNINNICFNALSLACALKKETVNCSIIEEVLSDLDLGTLEAQAPSSSGASQQHFPKQIPAATIPAPVRPLTWAPRLGAVAAVLALTLPFLYAGQNDWKVPASWLSVFESSAKQVSVAPPSSPARVSSPNSPAPDENFGNDEALAELPLTIPANFFKLRLTRGGARRPIVYPANNSATQTEVRSNAAAQYFSSMPVPMVTAAKTDFSIRQATEKKTSQETVPAPVSVQVGPTDTLWIICTRNLGKCDRDLIKKIVAINPCITNPLSLRPGLWLVMPPVTRASGYARGSAIEKEVASQ
jgi:hypothetical protein